MGLLTDFDPLARDVDLAKQAVAIYIDILRDVDIRIANIEDRYKMSAYV